MQTPPPSLTIVVASTARRERLAGDLALAAPQCTRDGVELIVARADTTVGLAELSATCPRARFVGAPPGTALHELRDFGFRAASGDVVALIEHTDAHGLPHDRWVSELRRRCSLHRRHQSSGDAATDAAAMLPRRELSVVVSAHQAGELLATSLAALDRSDLPRSRWELIVVDDASTDDTAGIAARFADVVVRLPGRPHGTAYARNRGFEFAHGDNVVFIDADVRVHPDTLTRFAVVFAREPEVTAVFGSFDTTPATPGLVSQYRNLLFHFHCCASADPVETLCASCAAVRSAVFAHAGMYDEWHFARHQLEDLELAHRLRAQGYAVVVRPDIQASHLKRWTLGRMIAADVADRTVPWIRLSRTNRQARLHAIKNTNAALTWLAAVLLLVGVGVGQPILMLVAATCIATALRNDSARYKFFVRHRGRSFLLAVVPLEVLSHLVHGVALVGGWLLRELLGEPKPHPTVEAFAEIGVWAWPPIPEPRTDAPPRPPATTLERPA